MNPTPDRIVPSATLNIRRAGPRDLIPLGFFLDTLLRRDYFLRRGQLEEMLRGPYHQVYVAEVDNILVGLAITTQGTRLVNVLVHPAYRGLQIGRALVHASGAVEVRAKLDMSTGDPRQFYANLGFRPASPLNNKGNIQVMRRPMPATSRERPPRRAAKTG
jgi:GNAT superfamily N-acetyltransferase